MECGHDGATINTRVLKQNATVADPCACRARCQGLAQCFFWTFEWSTRACLLRSSESMEFPLLRFLPQRGTVVGSRDFSSLSGSLSNVRATQGSPLKNPMQAPECRIACMRSPTCSVWSLRKRVCRLHQHAYFRFARGATMGLVPRFNTFDACSRVSYHLRRDDTCYDLEQAPLHPPSFSCDAGMRVPRIYHAIGPRERPPFVTMNVAANPSYRLNYHDDDSAPAYIRRHCGDRAARAFSCFVAPANRADLFRFCALYAEGGAYLDSDLVLMRPIEHLVSPCAAASVGRDIPQRGLPGVQMKALGGRREHPLFRCMLNRILDNVAVRRIPSLPLLVSGPTLLSKCYSNLSRHVAVTHIDTRHAYWPYTGLRTRDEVLAYEAPHASRHFRYEDANYYHGLFLHGAVYTNDCDIGVQKMP